MQQSRGITVEEFEQLATGSEHVANYGFFTGKLDHLGYAVVSESTFGYAQFCIELYIAGFEALAQTQPYIDSQGKGKIIISWSEECFMDEAE